LKVPSHWLLGQLNRTDITAAAAAASMPSLLELSAEDLINKGIAPVKKDFILPLVARKQVAPVAGSATVAETGTVSTKKKSKGQIKRVRSENVSGALR
jgi:hypothetical protein